MMSRRTLALACAIPLAWGQPALAEDAPKAVTLTLTQEELAVVGDALGEMPLKRALPVFAKIRQQLQEQPRGVSSPPMPDRGTAGIAPAAPQP